jgi:hypothetical protein
MVAVPEIRISAPVAVSATGSSAVPTHRRVVAVALSPMELLRPESDLARLAEGFPQVDLLVAGEDVPSTAYVPAGGYDGTDDDYEDDYDDDWFDSTAAEVRAGVARLGLPGLQLHRLGLRAPYPMAAEDDLVAAMSELIGFDPEPGVYCLAPVPVQNDAARALVNRAAQRVAQVYGIPLLRYRCLELSVVGC